MTYNELCEKREPIEKEIEQLEKEIKKLELKRNMLINEIDILENYYIEEEENEREVTN